MELKLIDIDKLTLSDLEKNPVWQFQNNDEIGELKIKPIKKYPVKSTSGKIFGTKVTLSNEEIIWALISNFNIDKPELNQHFITFSFYKNEKWFHLSRYHDFNFKKNGYKALAKFLKLNVDKIFPVKYNLIKLIKGEKDILIGELLKEPKIKLSRSEIIQLAVP